MTVSPPPGAATKALAMFALEIRLGEVPQQVTHEAVRILLDCLGCAVAGVATPAGKIAQDLVKDERGRLQATAVGQGQVSLMPATFANTVLTNALDFEPVGPEGHVCAVAVPAALAVAEAVDASGAEFLAALLAGLEVGGRVGGAIRRPGQAGHKSTPDVRGTAHAVFAATAAAGRLLKLTSEQMHHAFGIAGYSATLPTLKKVMASPHSPMTKYDHLGLIAQNGVQAALLAQRGFTGDLAVLESDIGFWRFAGALGCDWDLLTRDLGSYWTIPETWYKRYPVILYTNPAIDLVRQMAREHGTSPQSLTRIEVRATRVNEVQLGTEVRDSMDAWTRYAYNVAVGLFDVRPRRLWQDPGTYSRPDILALARKVELRPLRPEDLMTTGNYWEGWCPVRAVLETREGAYQGAIEFLPKIDDEELRVKFYDNVLGLLDEAVATELEQMCWKVAELGSVREIASLLQKVRLS